MKIDKAFILSFVAPLMILISALGFIFKDENSKIFYLPMGLMGILIISEKHFNRKLNRRKILRKIKSFQKAK